MPTGYVNPRTGREEPYPFAGSGGGIGGKLSGLASIFSGFGERTRRSEEELRRRTDELAAPIKLPEVAAPSNVSWFKKPEATGPPEAMAMEGLRLARDQPAAPPSLDDYEMEQAREGFKVSPEDIATIRGEAPAFLAANQGRAGRYDAPGFSPLAPAGNVDAARLDVADRLAIEGLQRAARGDEQAIALKDPAIRRRNAALNAAAEAETFLSPTQRAARRAAQEEELAAGIAKGTAGQQLEASPLGLMLKRLDAENRVRYAEAQAAGRGLGGILGATGAGKANTPASRGTISPQQLAGWAAENGFTIEQAAEFAQAQGYAVQPQ